MSVKKGENFRLQSPGGYIKTLVKTRHTLSRGNFTDRLNVNTNSIKRIIVRAPDDRSIGVTRLYNALDKRLHRLGKADIRSCLCLRHEQRVLS